MARKAMKFDDNKPRHHLLIDEFLDEMIKVRMFGSEKYEPWDWIHGLEFSRYQDAIKRHLKDFNAGEDADPESGLHHMAHIAISAMFLFTFQMLGAGVDDRHGVKAERILKRLRSEATEKDPKIDQKVPDTVIKKCENCSYYDDTDGLCDQPCTFFSHWTLKKQPKKSCENCRHHYSEERCAINDFNDCGGWASRKVKAS